jgi:hypothetical protein
LGVPESPKILYAQAVGKNPVGLCVPLLGKPTLHSRAVRGDELNCRSSVIYADFRLDYKLATLPFTPVVRAFLATDYSRGQFVLAGYAPDGLLK